MGIHNCRCLPCIHIGMKYFTLILLACIVLGAFAEPRRRGRGKGKAAAAADGKRPEHASASAVKRCRQLGKMNKHVATHMSDNDKAAWTECKAKFQARIDKFRACKAEEDEAKRDEMGCPKGKRPKGKGKRRKKGGRRG